MQPNDLFSFATLIDQVHEWASPWMANLLPWLGVMIGLTLVFVIARGLLDLIQNKFEDFSEWRLQNKENKYLNTLDEYEPDDYIIGSQLLRNRKERNEERYLNNDMFYDLHEQKWRKRHRGIIDTFLLK